MSLKNYILVPPGTVATVTEEAHPNGSWPLAAAPTHSVRQPLHAIFPPVGLWVTIPVESEAGPAGTRVKKIWSGDAYVSARYEILPPL